MLLELTANGDHSVNRKFASPRSISDEDTYMVLNVRFLSRANMSIRSLASMLIKKTTRQFLVCLVLLILVPILIHAPSPLNCFDENDDFKDDIESKDREVMISEGGRTYLTRRENH